MARAVPDGVLGRRPGHTRRLATKLQEIAPGAAGRPHVTIEGAGHFVQEETGEELGAVIADFVSGTG